MTAANEAARLAPASAMRRRWSRLKRRGSPPETRIALALAVTTFAITALIVLFTDQVPFTSLMVPLLLGSLLLGPRTLPGFVSFTMLMVAVSLSQQDPITTRTLGAVGIAFLMGLIVLVTSLRRSRLGVAGVMGEAMLVDLRDRILRQGGIPVLPNGWCIESALKSAGGTLFAGDFFVATRPPGTRVEVVVVDVSGKGEQAGIRALLLSGAFGGLLGALPPAQFLPAANDFLLRQNWEEGFATAVHLSLDLETGAFEIRSAGHPPAAHRAAGSGRWTTLESEGPILGVIEDAVFTCSYGHLGPGDAVLLYTDGMVEEPRRDIDLGIDRMLGEAESMLRGQFQDAAHKLVEALGSHDDDRAMLVVNRR